MLIIIIIAVILFTLRYLKEQNEKEVEDLALQATQFHEELVKLYQESIARLKSNIDEYYESGFNQDYIEAISSLNEEREVLRDLSRITWFVGGVLIGEYPNLKYKDIIRPYYDYSHALLWLKRCERDGQFDFIRHWYLISEEHKNHLLSIIEPFKHTIPEDTGFFTTEEFNYFKKTGKFYKPTENLRKIVN